MLGYFQRVKICCTLAGAAAVLVGQKIAESETIRKTAVDVMAAGIKVVNCATDFLKSIYDEAANKVDEEEKTPSEASDESGFNETADSVATYADDPATD